MFNREKVFSSILGLGMLASGCTEAHASQKVDTTNPAVFAKQPAIVKGDGFEIIRIGPRVFHLRRDLYDINNTRYDGIALLAQKCEILSISPWDLTPDGNKMREYMIVVENDGCIPELQ